MAEANNYDAISPPATLPRSGFVHGLQAVARPEFDLRIISMNRSVHFDSQNSKNEAIAQLIDHLKKGEVATEAEALPAFLTEDDESEDEEPQPVAAE